MRRARRQLKGPVAITGAIAGVILLAACSRGAGGADAAAVPGPPPSSSALQAAGPLPASGLPPASAPPHASGPVTEATSANAPLRVQVVSVRRESPDSIRVELTLANLAPADAWTPGSPATVAVRAAVGALDAASVLSADGRRRMFALRGSTGERVGTPAAVPAPGRPETFWALFPAAEAEVTIILPGFAPLAGLPVAPRAGRPGQSEP